MADVGAKFGLGGGGIHFKDPRQMFRGVIATAQMAIVDGGTAVYASNVSGFWTVLALMGVSDATSFTANTYKTLYSDASGMGYVANLIGPTAIGSTPTTTFEITVDGGTPFEIAIPASAAGQRAFLGPAGPTTAYTAANIAFNTTNIAMSAAGDVVGMPDASRLWGWPMLHSNGTPLLLYKNSLLVRVKSSESNSTSTNFERNCGISTMTLA